MVDQVLQSGRGEVQLGRLRTQAAGYAVVSTADINSARLDVQAEEVVESFGQVHRLDAGFAVAVDVQLVGERPREFFHVEQGFALARLPLEHVLEQIVVELERLLAGSVVKLNVVQRVLVGLQADDLDDARPALRFLCRGHALRLAVLPFGAEGDLFDARQEHGVEVVGHIHQDELAPPTILAVQVDDGVAGGAGAGEEVENHIVSFV